MPPPPEMGTGWEQKAPGVAGRSALVVSLALAELPIPGCSVPQFTG